MESIQSLPPILSVSPSTLSFLNHKFNAEEDLNQAINLVSDLENQCCNLDQNLIDLNRILHSSLSAYASHSDRIDCLLGNISAKLSHLDASTRVSGSSLDGAGAEAKDLRRTERILGEELPALAKEVARVEAVRAYAELVLKLDILVGDLEDAVSSVMNRKRKHFSTHASEDKHVLAIKSLKLIENVLTSVTKTRPQWTRIVSAVDHRVDRALAILRPHEIADHRALLASLGWPPPLSTLNISSLDTTKSNEAPTPLFTMQGDLKHHYCENFLALCSLQELQRQRKSRQLEGYNQEGSLHQPLWAIEELVSPISIASQHHFSKWVDKPEFIFALVYKVTRDYVDSMDELLQPLVDRAMLTGYSCREEWISGMVSSLSTYFAKEIFPPYVSQLDEESVTGIRSPARISWLHLVDLMITFDKRVQSLAAQSGLMLSLQEDGDLQRISSLSVFCDRPDWLDIWAEIELTDTLDKLKADVEDERNWITRSQESLLSGPEYYKSPSISSVFVQRLSFVFDRCRSLPSISLRSRFTRLAGAPLILNFLDHLLLRCQEAEGLTALTDDNALIKVMNSINAARYFESILKDWCMDFFFLEMGVAPGDQLGIQGIEDTFNGGHGNGIFDEEIGKLEGFRTEWIKKISDAILRGFDGLCRDYMKNRKQWHEKGEEGLTVSKSFVGALDYLQGKVSILEGSLNGVDFVQVWRSLAAEVDRRIFDNILTSNVKFNDGGVERLHSDFQVLFMVFGAWCLRPEVFFPKVSEGLKLLKMGEKRVRHNLLGGEQWLKDHGISHLSVHEAEKIAKSRVFTS